ncbi:hypothetical protein, partial [Pseudoalteromonas sp. MelDa3]|uniref:hypothetical protein n=1 Tax=Pseudoalteromonas sp. MelDa3 TaxID=888435 RepID=UPI001C60F516
SHKFEVLPQKPNQLSLLFVKSYLQTIGKKRGEQLLINRLITKRFNLIKNATVVQSEVEMN